MSSKDHDRCFTLFPNTARKSLFVMEFVCAIVDVFWNGGHRIAQQRELIHSHLRHSRGWALDSDEWVRRRRVMSNQKLGSPVISQ